jgi:DNA polymerase III sliding clamp (beta) subunit (PCNA family)
MQITVQRGELKEAVAGLGKIVNGKSHTLPILGCVRFAANGNGIVAQVTDLDQHLRYRFCGAQANGDGGFIIPLSSIKDLARGKDQEQIEFEAGANSAVLVTNHVGSQVVKHPLNGMDPDEWPSCPADGRLKARRLALGMDQAAAAAKLGYSNGWLSKVEHLDIRLDVMMFIRLCRALGVRAHRLVRNAEEESEDSDASFYLLDGRHAVMG